MTTSQTNFVVDLVEKTHVPIISFSTTDLSLNRRNSYLFHATQNAAFQMEAIADIVKAFEWTKVVPIYSDIVYSETVIPSLTDALLKGGAHVTYVSVVSFSSSDSEIEKELRKLMTMQTRVFVVHSDVDTGTRIFTKANEIGMMKEGYVWILTDEMTSFLSSLESLVVDSLQGVLGIKTYVPETTELKEFRARRGKFLGEYGLSNAFGLRAYDAVTSIAIAVEEVWKSHNHPGFENDSGNSTLRGLETLGVSVSKYGPELLRALSGLEPRKGLSGEFVLASSSRQVNESIYQVINVHGSGEKVVGFWTTQNRLTRYLDSTTTRSKDDLGLIIWPGESTTPPKGWEISTANTTGRLRIGVPVKFGLKEFVKVEYDPVTNATNVTGYCIDIFKALVKQLPYDLEYEFIPYGPFMGLYDSIVYQVYLGRFDIAIGDITITANRSLYVDFTLPYTEGGASVIMPVRLRGINNTWIFLKPWTWDLWVLIASFFVFNAFVVWILERQINKDFQGPVSYQMATSVWFSFSTMAYAHREKVVNNLARMVVVIWIFVVFILTQSYAASLTSFLTIQQLRPITDTILSELVKSGENVAYQSGIVYGPLRELGFADSQLRRYLKHEDARDMLAKGEVAAIIDEVPYNKLFLAKYCSNYGYYDIVDKRLRAEGFAFVFQRGSPLSADISKALMKTIRGSEFLAPIENKWFGRKTDCKDPSEEVISSSRLGPKSFRGLFLISGFSSLSALAIHAVTMFCARRRNVNNSSIEASTWENFLFGSKVFHRKNSIYDSSRSVHSNGSMLHGVVPIETIEAIENASNNSITSSYFNHVDTNFNNFGSSIDNQEPSIIELTIQNNQERAQDQ